MSYLVELTDRARRDADHIFEWIVQRSPDGAERWYTSFRAALESLRSTPLSRAPTPESEAFVFEIRQLLFKTPRGRPYRALDIVEG
jgi:plasmid stabilization system protein ParE